MKKDEIENNEECEKRIWIMTEIEGYEWAGRLDWRWRVWKLLKIKLIKMRLKTNEEYVWKIT